MGIGSFMDRLLGRARPPAPEVAEPAPLGPLSALEAADPLALAAADYLFPLAFQAGKTPIRGRPTSVRSGEAALEGLPEGPWFWWKAETGAGAAGGYWCLPPSLPPRDAEAAAAWAKTATALAGAAAARLKALLAAAPGLAPSSFAAGAFPQGGAPKLAGKSALRLDFRYAARGAFRRGSAFTSPGYAEILAGALGPGHGRASAGGRLQDLPARSESPAGADPIGALLSASESILARNPASLIASRSFSFGLPEGPLSYLPLYECLNLLSDADLRLVVQNRLVPKAQGGSFGALFSYREAEPSAPPAGATGTAARPSRPAPGAAPEAKAAPEAGAPPPSRVVGPESLDRERLYPLLPEAVLEEGRLDPEHAAADARDFLARNDAAYEDLFRATRSGSLALSERGAALARELYLSMVYGPKRRGFEAFLRESRPVQELAGLPERIARRAVDLSGARSLAAAVFGDPGDLAYVAKWCSKGKRAEIEDEQRRVAAALDEGLADLEALKAERGALLAKAKAVMEEERR